MLPRLYPIIDPALIPGPGDQASRVAAFAHELAEGGATLIQYRNKTGSGRQMLSDARELRRALGSEVRLIMNDRADLCLAAGFDGVHVGQEDLSPESARMVVGDGLWVGVSTHSVEQVIEADKTSADYIAIGPVFATGSKQNPDPVVGLEGSSRCPRGHPQAAGRDRRNYPHELRLGHSGGRGFGRRHFRFST